MAKTGGKPLARLPIDFATPSRLAHPILGMETFFYSRMNSPVGRLNVAVSGRSLVLLEFDRGTFPPVNAELIWTESEEATSSHVGELGEYFAGQRRDFTFPLDLRGTEFQLKCWDALLQIPYGETRTYADIARAVGQPQGFRAVGSANHRNPIAIVVPCHRVIASNGTLCGYGGGLDRKRKLLDLEARFSGLFRQAG